MGGSISKKTSDSKLAGEGAPPENAGAPEGGGGGGGAPAGGGGAPAAAARVIPTVFRWEHGGNHVYVAGTFNGWHQKIPLHRSGNDFITIQGLSPGRHAYKFVVDDEWRFAPDQPAIADLTGNINNVIDLSDFHLEGEVVDDCVPWATGTEAAAAIKRRDSLPLPYGTAQPQEEAYAQEPPSLPPHLRQLVLNAGSPGNEDLAVLQSCSHVTLAHLCACSCPSPLFFRANKSIPPPPPLSLPPPLFTLQTVPRSRTT
jgi:hypothetical protein